MTPTAARRLYERLQDELGCRFLGAPLAAHGWTFGFDSAKRRLGVCKPDRLRIQLSRHFLTLPDDQVEDTLRHEIAHAIDHHRRGCSDHSAVWQRLARACGARPERTCAVPPEHRPAYRWYLRCPHCHHQYGFYRKPRTTTRRACGRCCNQHAGGRWDPRFVLQLLPATSGA